MKAKEILSLDARQLSDQIEKKKITCSELMQATIERIKQVNEKHKAVISLIGDYNELMELAREADNTPPHRRRGWLHGIPFAVKDLSNVKGIPTSMGGSSLFQDFIPDFNDDFVENIISHGAIIIGKTNSPECGLGSHTYNDRWGTTTNPFDTSKSAGGSSGGAAVAVATGMLCLADGSDMMGSLRNPAGWNLLYSHRPTAGIIKGGTPWELNPLPYPISTPGPIARNPIDCALLLETMAGMNTFDASPLLESVHVLQEEEEEDSLRIGWLGDWNGSMTFEEGILSLCRGALEALNGKDVIIVEDVDEGSIATMSLAKIWDAWNSVRFSLASFTYTQNFEIKVLLDKSSSIKDELKWEISRGLLVSHDDLKRAGDVQREFSKFLDGLFETYDILALPSAQVWPFPENWTWPRSIGSVKMDTYHRWMEVCVPVSFGGLPCSTIPAGLGESNCPMGVQLFARRGDDLKLLRLATFYHELSDWPSRVEWVDTKEATLRLLKKKCKT